MKVDIDSLPISHCEAYGTCEAVLSLSRVEESIGGTVTSDWVGHCAMRKMQIEQLGVDLSEYLNATGVMNCPIRLAQNLELLGVKLGEEDAS